MQILVSLDPVPVEPGDPIFDPGKHKRVGLQGGRSMFVQLVRLGRDTFLGLRPQQPIILPGSESKE